MYRTNVIIIIYEWCTHNIIIIIGRYLNWSVWRGKSRAWRVKKKKRCMFVFKQIVCGTLLRLHTDSGITAYGTLIIIVWLVTPVEESNFRRMWYLIIKNILKNVTRFGFFFSKWNISDFKRHANKPKRIANLTSNHLMCRLYYYNTLIVTYTV